MRNVYVVAAIIKSEGKYLITKRLLGTNNGGKWEFPGGKIEDGESPETALIREIKEELDLEIGVIDIVSVFTHKKEKMNIVILFYDCYIIKGSPQKVACEDFRWVFIDNMVYYDFAPADMKMYTKLVARRRPIEKEF